MNIKEDNEETGQLVDKCHRNLYEYVKTGEVGENIFLKDTADLLLLAIQIFEDPEFSNVLFDPLLHNYDVQNVPDEYKSAIIAMKLTELLDKSGCQADINTMNSVLKEYIDSLNF
jgi:DNA mismatch repair ATPase MutS